MSIIKNKFAFLIIVIGLFYLLPFYNENFYLSHDSEPQVARSAAVYKALSDGQVPPRWAESLNYSYGVPSPNFFFPLMGYLISFLHILGIPLESAYKIVIGSAFVLCGAAFYLWISQKFEDRIAFGSSIIYMLAPYHFANTFVRGQLGEMLAFTFAPLVLFALDRFSKSKSIHYALFGAICFAFLIISHNILALLFAFIFGLYVLISTPTIKIIVEKSIILLLGLSISAYFWVPALIEGKYINSKVLVAGYFSDHFIKPTNIIHAPWGFGPNINEIGGFAPQLGLIVSVLILISLLALSIKKERKHVLFWLTVLLISVFFTNELSSFVWTRIHTLEQFQFPWRFIAVASFAAAVLSAYAFKIIQKNIFIYIIVVITLLSSVNYMQVAGFVKKPNSFYLNYPGTGAYHGESTTIWTEGDASAYPAFPVEVIAGSGKYSDYRKKSNLHTFKVKAETDLVVKDNTTYYPGWRAFVNGEEVPIQFQDPNHRGYITFAIPKGSHQIEVKFSETAVRLFADLVSTAAVLLTLLLFLYRKKIDKLISRR